MLRSNRPQVTFFAGLNGSGKSSLYGAVCEIVPALKTCTYINPDELTIEAEGNFRLGAELAIKKRKVCLQENLPFVFESTFSGNSEIKVLEEAKRKGFKINGCLIGIDDPTAKTNVQRIGIRVFPGGHDVPSEDVFRRSERIKVNYKK